MTRPRHAKHEADVFGSIIVGNYVRWFSRTGLRTHDIKITNSRAKFETNLDKVS